MRGTGKGWEAGEESGSGYFFPPSAPLGSHESSQPKGGDGFLVLSVPGLQHPLLILSPPNLQVWK